MQEVADPAVILEVGLLGKGQRGRGRGALRALGSRDDAREGAASSSWGSGVALDQRGERQRPVPIQACLLPALRLFVQEIRPNKGSDPSSEPLMWASGCAQLLAGCFYHRGDLKTLPTPPTPPAGTAAPAPAYLRLGQLVVVVGEPEVEAPSVNVHRGSQESARHGRAFDVPSRTPLQSQTTP